MDGEEAPCQVEGLALSKDVWHSMAEAGPRYPPPDPQNCTTPQSLHSFSSLLGPGASLVALTGRIPTAHLPSCQ